MPTFILTIILGGLLAGTAGAAVDPEQMCQAGRAKAAAKYVSCAQKAIAKFWPTYTTYAAHWDDRAVLGVATGKCVTQYAATWPKLQAKASGTGVTCDSVRFTDNGDGTVTDRLTALQ